MCGCGEITSRHTLKTGHILLVRRGRRLAKLRHIGEKVTAESSTIGSNVKIGDRVKLNNVVVMDSVSIGRNAVLQIISGVGATIGEICNLKDCQVGGMCMVASGAKTVEKGERGVSCLIDEL